MTEEITRPWQYSVKLETNAKGYIQPSIHIYSDDLNCNCELGIHGIIIDVLDKLVDKLKESGYRVATDITEDPPKNNHSKEVKK